MSINDDNKAAPAAAQQTQRAADDGARSTSRAGTQWSFHGSASRFAPIASGVGSEFYNKLKSNLVEIYKASNDDVEVSIIDLDNVNNPALNFGAIVVALRIRENPELGVAYHTLLLEATGQELTPLLENINGVQTEITRVTSDALEDKLLRLAEQKVKDAFPRSNIFMVDGTVVPRSFNPEDKVAVHRLALNAGLACYTELGVRDPSFQDLNLLTLAHDSAMTINIKMNKTQVEDAVGAPMRSDALAQFSSSKKSNGQGQGNLGVNAGDRDLCVAEVSGFVETLWAPVANAGMMNPYAPQMQGATQKYVARFNITNLASEFNYTPGSVLLGLATAMALRDDSNWLQTFIPEASGRTEIDLRDIGALNYEANLENSPTGVGQRIATKGPDFGTAELCQLATALIQPGLMFGLDCPEVGPQSFYLSLFPAAAGGRAAAYDIIYRAADTLTGGGFSKYFPHGAPMFVDFNNRVHLGTWTDRNGNRRDIRDIDHLAVCNLVGERNPTAIREWSDTFLNVSIPLARRLAQRKRMLMNLTNETAKITGFAQRVTFAGPFLDALSRGIRESGMTVRINTPMSGDDFNNQRGVANFASNALLVPGQSFMQAGGFYSPQQFNGGNSSYRY